MTQVKIEYRYQEGSNTLFPFYRFSGTATNDQGTKLEVEIITPAIETVAQ